MIGRLREAVKAVKGMQLFMQPEPEIVTGTDFARNEYVYSLIDPDRAELEKWLPIVEDKLKTVPGLLDVSRENQAAAPAAQVVVNREIASRLGVDPQVIDDTLYDAFGAAMPPRSSPMQPVLRHPGGRSEIQSGPEALDLIHVAARDGKQIRLSAFAHFEQQMATSTVTHRGQFPVEKISFNSSRPVARRGGGPHPPDGARSGQAGCAAGPRSRAQRRNSRIRWPRSPG
ncbi:MAG: efflux RND transporter permease subunit [Aliidongia sp.]